MQAREITTKSKALEIIIKKKKDKKEQSISRHVSLFGNCPDEIVLIILSYGTLSDLQSTRIWQSKKVQHCTESILKVKAAEKNNFDNIRWIYRDIGNTMFIEPSQFKNNCTGILIRQSKK